jgi:ABC-2 type transport system ATP-binding protein
LVQILSTLLKPDSGQARIAGYDVVREPEKVRGVISLTGQYAAVDELLTGEENMLMMGRLYHLSQADTRRRATELLEALDLTSAAKQAVKTYSGGMRRRLDLAISLIAAPPVIFLDEPTTGLDPRSRLAVWDIVKQLAAVGVTIFLTTQYLEEADALADQIALLDGGKVIAQGTATALKQQIGRDRLELNFGDEQAFDRARQVIGEDVLETDAQRRLINVALENKAGNIRKVLEQLEGAGVAVDSVYIRKPTLDDVFFSLTGQPQQKESVQ